MILVTGNGTLAKELVKLSTNETSIVSLSRKTMDITDEYVVSDVIKKYMMTPDKPKYLIHSAALTKPMEINDTNPIESLSVNIVGTANVARICHKYGIKFIYISTDFVYPSREYNYMPLSHTEETPLKPSNNYGWSKLGGECVTQLVSDSLILRCALCDIPFRHSVAFTDVYRNSITHKDIAPLILKLKDETGVINLAGDNKTVYDFVSQYQEIDKGSGKSIAPSLKLNTQKLKELLGE
jgi:dTDP-4-dehydrorhamnose reductase